LTTNVLWRELYAAAMLELDRAQLQSRIEAAQVAIRQAMTELHQSGTGSREELQALADSLHNLQTLQRVELSVPTPAASPAQRLAEGRDL